MLLHFKNNVKKYIAKYLNKNFPTSRVWAKNSILWMLTNEIYTGTLIWNKSGDENYNVKVKDSHPAIISKEDFKKVQNIMHVRRPKITHPRSSKTKDLLNGLLYCTSCKNTLNSYSAKSGKFFYYMCQSKFKSGKNICSQKVLRIDKFDAPIVDVLKKKILTVENISNLVKLVLEEFGILKKEYLYWQRYLEEHIKDKKRRLYKLFDLLETSDAFDLTDIPPRIIMRTKNDPDKRN